MKDKDAPGYSDIIKDRIALSDMKKKISLSQYKHIQELNKDVALMVSNCQLYNIEGSFPYEVKIKNTKNS